LAFWAVGSWHGGAGCGRGRPHSADNLDTKRHHAGQDSTPWAWGIGAKGIISVERFELRSGRRAEGRGRPCKPGGLTGARSHGCDDLGRELDCLGNARFPVSAAQGKGTTAAQRHGGIRVQRQVSIVRPTAAQKMANPGRPPKSPGRVCAFLSPCPRPSC